MHAREIAREKGQLCMHRALSVCSLSSVCIIVPTIINSHRQIPQRWPQTLSFRRRTCLTGTNRGLSLQSP